MGSFSQIIRYSNILADDIEISEYRNRLFLDDTTPIKNQRRKLKDLIEILLNITDIYFTSEKAATNSYIAFFCNKFINPMRNIENINQATEIFLAAMLIVYRNDIKKLSGLKELKNNSRMNIFLERKEAFVEAISEMAIYMNRIEYAIAVNSLYDTNRNIDREVYWLMESGLNYHDGGMSGKILSNESLTENYYIQYMNVPTQNVLYSWVYEPMSERLFKLFLKTHKPNKPFWDSIVIGFFYVLCEFFNLTEKKPQQEYLSLENTLEEVLYIVKNLPTDKKMILLSGNEKIINELHKSSCQIKESMSPDEKNQFSGLLQMSRMAQLIRNKIE